jgi:cellulose 1,4-beta-cellobiosidase
LSIACATGVGVDDQGGPGFGGSSSGGAAGTAGKVDNPNQGGGGSGNATSGGGAPSGGAPSGGGGDVGGGGVPSGGGAGGCPSNQKSCGGVCVQPNPGIGCNLTDCTPCPAPPPNSNWICTSSVCDFTCNAGYAKQGQTCVSSGGGGAPSGGGGTTSGGGGSGGGGTCAAPCDPSQGSEQFVCFAFCVFSGGAGLCVPGLNCCTCF